MEAKALFHKDQSVYIDGVITNLSKDFPLIDDYIEVPMKEFNWNSGRFDTLKHNIKVTDPDGSTAQYFGGGYVWRVYGSTKTQQEVCEPYVDKFIVLPVTHPVRVAIKRMHSKFRRRTVRRRAMMK